eukprot:Sspe_Gene.17854::Locus_6376_Transcript_1_1_Confidence_1.000_Length_2644::g.17854::m.17854
MRRTSSLGLVSIGLAATVLVILGLIHESILSRHSQEAPKHTYYHKLAEQERTRSAHLEAELRELRKRLSRSPLPPTSPPTALPTLAPPTLAPPTLAPPTPTPCNTSSLVSRIHELEGEVARLRNHSAQVARQPSFNPVCRDTIRNGSFRIEVRAASEPIKAMDFVTGNAMLTLTISDETSCGLEFQLIERTYIDPYLEMHKMSTQNKSSVCDSLFLRNLERELGVPFKPTIDFWLYKYHNASSGKAVQLVLQPRHNLTVSRGVHLNITIPRECVGDPHAVVPDDIPMERWPSVVLHTPPVPRPVVGIGGDVMRSLNDGVLADGGRTGWFAVSHGMEWKHTDEVHKAVQEILETAFGPTASLKDAVHPGPAPNTLAFTLAARPVATAMNGPLRVHLPSFPPHFFDSKSPTSQAVDVVDVVDIEDVVVPFAHMEGMRGFPVFDEEALMAGGGVFNLSLHAGVYFNTSHTTLQLLREMLICAFGQPSKGEDTVVVSPTVATITLARRTSITAEHRHSTHFMVPLHLHIDALMGLAPQSSPSCWRGFNKQCTYQPARSVVGDRVVPVSPTIVVRRAQHMSFKWAVIGGGISGLNALGRVLDTFRGGHEQVLWVDDAVAGRAFTVGRLSGYKSVQSTQDCEQFSTFLSDHKVFQTIPWGSAYKPLQSAALDRRHCRLGFFVELMQKFTHHLRGRVVSFAGAVRHMRKVFYPGTTPSIDSSSFIWSLGVADYPRVWVTNGIILAIGGVPTPVPPIPGVANPPVIPFTEVLDLGRLRHALLQKLHKKGNEGAHVVVYGGGPSAYIALFNLALLDEVSWLTQVVKRDRGGDYVKAPVFRKNGSEANLRRIIFEDTATRKQVLKESD